jgi:hypothetical protein
MEKRMAIAGRMIRWKGKRRRLSDRFTPADGALDCGSVIGTDILCVSKGFVKIVGRQNPRRLWRQPSMSERPIDEQDAPFDFVQRHGTEHPRIA